MEKSGATEIRAFVPSKNFEQSKAFYTELGFDIISCEHGVAYVSLGGSSFLLQDFYVKEYADNCMMHLLVDDVDHHWRHVCDTQLEARFDVRVSAPADQPWGMRDFTLHDPSGVLWRIGQRIDMLQ